MNFIYPFLVAFSLVFVSELGDKTQLLVLSFSQKDRAFKILLGVAIGSFFSHGIAILFGSSITLFENENLHQLFKFFTYCSFLIMGTLSLLPPKEQLSMEESKKDGILFKISHLKLNYCLIIALCILFGELGDKTFLASIGLGVQYPAFKPALIAGAVLAMVSCNLLAILFGKFLKQHSSESDMQKLSGFLFLLFGLVGFISVFCD